MLLRRPTYYFVTIFFNFINNKYIYTYIYYKTKGFNLVNTDILWYLNKSNYF